MEKSTHMEITYGGFSLIPITNENKMAPISPHFQLCAIIVLIFLSSLAFNFFRLWEHDFIPCKSYEGAGFKLESSEYSCTPSLLYIFSVALTIGVNNLLPFFLLVATNIYTVSKLFSESTVKKTGKVNI